MPQDFVLTPEILRQAYCVGVFPMSESRDDPEIFWVDPQQRGILPLETFRISRSHAKTLRKWDYEVTFDSAFAEVVKGCADRDETWINDTIFDLYRALHESNDAHSVEVWQNGTLIGGAYGVSIGGAFFGESMFSLVPDASKTALAFLIDRLRRCGYTLLDTQFITPHLTSLGAVEIPRAAYQEKLAQALKQPADFAKFTEISTPYDVIQRNAQTS